MKHATIFIMMVLLGFLFISACQNQTRDNVPEAKAGGDVYDITEDEAEAETQIVAIPAEEKEDEDVELDHDEVIEKVVELEAEEEPTSTVLEFQSFGTGMMDTLAKMNARENAKQLASMMLHPATFYYTRDIDNVEILKIEVDSVTLDGLIEMSNVVISAGRDMGYLIGYKIDTGNPIEVIDGQSITIEEMISVMDFATEIDEMDNMAINIAIEDNYGTEGEIVLSGEIQLAQYELIPNQTEGTITYSGIFVVSFD